MSTVPLTVTSKTDTYTNALTSILPSSSGSITPFSVIIPLIFMAGVISKAGFQHGMPSGALLVEISSSADRSSIGISDPLSKVISNEVMGAAT
jgi:hypothetical protein